MVPLQIMVDSELPGRGAVGSHDGGDTKHTVEKHIQLLVFSLRDDHMTTAHCKGKTGSDVNRKGCQHSHSTVTQIFHQLQLVHSLFQPHTHTHTHTHTGLLPQKMREIYYYL